MILPGADGPDDPAPLPALVVFTDGDGIWWLRALRPGFRHVFVAICRAGHWVVVNPLSHRATLDLVPRERGADLATWYRARGYTVLETTTRTAPRREAPWAPLTCVEVVKRLLGVHARWVLTPHALYRHLTDPARPRPRPAQYRPERTMSVSTRTTSAS
jgi:hypothetical protein